MATITLHTTGSACDGVQLCMHSRWMLQLDVTEQVLRAQLDLPDTPPHHGHRIWGSQPTSQVPVLLVQHCTKESANEPLITPPTWLLIHPIQCIADDMYLPAMPWHAYLKICTCTRHSAQIHPSFRRHQHNPHILHQHWWHLKQCIILHGKAAVCASLHYQPQHMCSEAHLHLRLLACLFSMLRDCCCNASPVELAMAVLAVVPCSSSQAASLDQAGGPLS